MVRFVKTPKSDFQSYLHQGRYQDILDQVVIDKSIAEKDRVALIGAHSFLGQTEKAIHLLRVFQDSFHSTLLIQARFYLGIALARTSQFRQSKKYLKSNLDLAQTKIELSYAFQGAGFYSYFQGRFDRAIYFSKKALENSLEAGETYIEFLAMDLFGHATVQGGQRSLGLRHIKEASLLAQARGNANFANAFRDATLIYEAEIGVNPQHVVQKLENSLNSTKINDSYTRANLILELARQLTLRGRFAEAKALLNRTAPSIYSYDNKRQETMLQLRLAEIAYHQGDFDLMNHLIQSAKKSVSVLADHAFELRLLGLELKLPENLGGSRREESIRKIHHLSEHHSSRINRQILFRQGLSGVDPETPVGEDPLYDLWTLAKTDPLQAQKECLRLGYLGVYREIAHCRPGSAFLRVIEDREGFVAGHRDVILFSSIKFTSQQTALLRALNAANATKASLIKSVWGYDYDPLRHDSLIYNAIAKLRKLLGEFAGWIVTTESGWHWDRSVQLQIDVQEMLEPAKAVRFMAESRAPSSELNFRQIQSLRTIPKDSGWSVGLYKRIFNVSTMTAFRDLTYLHKKGLLIKTGRGRACRYLISEEG